MTLKLMIVVTSLSLSLLDASFTVKLIEKGLATEGNPVLVYLMDITGFGLQKVKLMLDAVVYSILIALPLEQNSIMALMCVITFQFMVVVSQATVLSGYYFQ